MALVIDPLNRSRRIRINDGYDNQDVIVENALSQKHKFKDLHRTDQLTQNSWNLSPYTRINEFRDVTFFPGRIEGRLDRYKGVIRPDKIREPRG